MVHTARAALEEENNAASGSRMNALARAAFEKHQSEARKHTLGALKAQSLFWEALQAPQPSRDTLHRYLKALLKSTAAAERSFKHLMALNGESVVALRLVS